MRKLTPKQLLTFVDTLGGDYPSVRDLFGEALIICPVCAMKYLPGTNNQTNPCKACDGNWEQAQNLEKSVQQLLLSDDWAKLSTDDLRKLYEAFFNTHYGLELGARIRARERQDNA